MSDYLKITVEGSTRGFRRKILDSVRELIQQEQKYVFSGGKYPLSGDTSSQTYMPVNRSMIYSDMSVDACMCRYEDNRNRILKLIKEGKISASMSGIECYPKPALKLSLDRHEGTIKSALTWNGQYHEDREFWREDFQEWFDLNQGDPND